MTHYSQERGYSTCRSFWSFWRFQQSCFCCQSRLYLVFHLEFFNPCFLWCLWNILNWNHSKMVLFSHMLVSSLLWVLLLLGVNTILQLVQVFVVGGVGGVFASCNLVIFANCPFSFSSPSDYARFCRRSFVQTIQWNVIAEVVNLHHCIVQWSSGEWKFQLSWGTAPYVSVTVKLLC